MNIFDKQHLEAIIFILVVLCSKSVQGYCERREVRVISSLFPEHEMAMGEAQDAVNVLQGMAFQYFL